MILWEKDIHQLGDGCTRRSQAKQVVVGINLRSGFWLFLLTQSVKGCSTVSQELEIHIIFPPIDFAGNTYSHRIRIMKSSITAVSYKCSVRKTKRPTILDLRVKNINLR